MDYISLFESSGIFAGLHWRLWYFISQFYLDSSVLIFAMGVVEQL
jgi:hypothetical protein